MAKEPTLEECWEEWTQSGNPDLVTLADALAPHLSIREEMNSARMETDMDKVIYIGKVIRKYTGPKDTFRDTDQALKALYEIRAYNP